MSEPITFKQYSLLMQLLQAKVISGDEIPLRFEPHKLTKFEAREIISETIKKIRERRQREYNYEVMVKHEGTPIEEVRENANKTNEN